MVIAPLRDPVLRSAVRAAARPDEDVVEDVADVADALRLGFPRLIVRGPGEPAHATLDGDGRLVPVVDLARAPVERWRDAWRTEGLRQAWTAALADRLRPVLSHRASAGWVDRVFRDLGSVVGAPLPAALSGFGRRVMEFPAGYQDVGSMARLAGLTDGALKARFRRRDLPSPFSYLRWFRAITIAHLLEEGRSTLRASQRLGWTNSGNLCRYLDSVTGLSVTDLREPDVRERMLLRFARAHLDEASLARWDGLDDLFLRAVA